MTFDVTADAYGRFMGRYSEPLAAEFAALSVPRDGDRALDVGCGPGALTAQLVRRLGADAVTAVDPSASFVDAARARFPDVDVRQASAEHLPFDDDAFDLALAQLVVHFMSDPVAGLVEMSRVTRPGGVVAACVWDHAGGGGPLSTFWRAVHDIDPSATGEAELAGAREGHLAELFEAAGLHDVAPDKVEVTVDFASFEDWWAPYTLGVGPAGAYVAQLDQYRVAALRDRCAELLPRAHFSVRVSAWSAAGRA
ncbi:MAG: methyltransferase domain-containing protein [Actinomycetota bacterium]|nr:methyltransferase domain-containing protein [Actinomycetota bacterium]